MAVMLGDVARRLREFIAALDRRAPRVEEPAEAGIARDSAVLRQKAVNQLAEIADQPTAPAIPPDRLN